MDVRVPTTARAGRVLWSRRPAAVAITVAIVAVAAVLATWPLAREMGSATLSDGEVLLTAWQLNAFHQALLTNPLVWAAANIYFPYGNAATFNDLLLTHAVVTLPAAWAESPVLALNLAMLGGIVLCGVCAHLMIDELVDAPWAAMIGGILFAITPFRFLHLGHLSIAAAWTIPLFFWAVLRHLRQPSWARAAVAAACGLALALSSLYHAAYVAPVVPLLLAFGMRRGPGGRGVWLPLVVTGGCGLIVLTWFLFPYLATFQTFGVAAAPDDLLRYGADLSSLGRKPDFLGGELAPGIDAEAQLYPGAALAALAAVALLVAGGRAFSQGGWPRSAFAAVLCLAAVVTAGIFVPLNGLGRETWEILVLTMIWGGPLVLVVWAIAATAALDATRPHVAIRLGLAGAALSFALALGPEARYMGEAIGPAPYSLLARASSLFEGTRVPARFGGIVMLFLALAAAGALSALARSTLRRRHLVAVGAGVVAVAISFAELPLQALPEGRPVLAIADLSDPAYAWLRERQAEAGVLELPDWPSDAAVNYRYREWRSLRYMLASKQHGRHLANGTGRVGPFLWARFKTIDPWTDDFFLFIASYLPVRYVLVHEAGLLVESREGVWARLTSGEDGWSQVFHSAGTRVYTVDRSTGRGPVVDRIWMRREVAPSANVAFEARIGQEPGEAGNGVVPSAILDLLRDGEPVASWPLGHEWQRMELSVPVDADAPDRYGARCQPGEAPCSGWPRTGVLFRWQVQGGPSHPVEIRGLSIETAELSAGQGVRE